MIDTPPKYAKTEHERRFLVTSVDELDLSLFDHVQIHDLYITGTRMRLRSVTDASGDVVYKLCKKYPTKDSLSGAIVNTYLSLDEYHQFKSLPGQKILKRRYRYRKDGELFGINVFESHLDGLVLCEAEKNTREELLSLKFPEWAKFEVTEDPFFTGGHLATISPDQLGEKLSNI